VVGRGRTHGVVTRRRPLLAGPEQQLELYPEECRRFRRHVRLPLIKRHSFVQEYCATEEREREREREKAVLQRRNSSSMRNGWLREGSGSSGSPRWRPRDRDSIVTMTSEESPWRIAAGCEHVHGVTPPRSRLGTVSGRGRGAPTGSGGGCRYTMPHCFVARASSR